VGAAVIHGCWSTTAVNGSHLLALQDAGTACPKGATPISWNMRGPAGPAGADGLSAYEIWMRPGHTGDVNAFLAALVGAAGGNGVDGTNGVNGLSAHAAYPHSADGPLPLPLAPNGVELTLTRISPPAPRISHFYPSTPYGISVFRITYYTWTQPCISDRDHPQRGCLAATFLTKG
jgi:hypothetical protein